MDKTIKIASGQGFWGDLPVAPVEQVRNGDIDYLMMDYLAEVTMSIMQKQKMRNPALGYARDFVEVVKELLPEITSNKVRIVSNAGGVNPQACAKAILELAKQTGKSIRVAVVDGDDILEQITSLLHAGYKLDNMETGESVETVQEALLSANVYFGAQPIVEALEGGAQVVITGRVTDTGLCLAPMIHEFGWSFDDFDKMAAGTVAGHILECGAQSSGGNFTDWQHVPDFVNIGFPIVEASADGSFVVTKHENSGGLVHSMTVKEQLLYEIGNPQLYITPDCVADFSSVMVKDVGANRVQVSNIKGQPATPFYKVSASYLDGYKITGSLTYCWPDALVKAVKAKEILCQRAKKLNIQLNSIHSDFIGYNGCDEKNIVVNSDTSELDEVQLRFSATSNNDKDLNRLGMEVAPLILTGPSGVTGFAGGRPKASEIVAYWPALLRKEAVTPRVHFFQTT
ncbi:MAG: DUF1446 domain-containing protein [Bacteroidetes bacterium]|nr:DUF1446 domain-containing protein [Bacteroidota bacterium]MCH8522951.1 DUF1446 domain-containing protein [Balneolales bacterium]